MASKITCTIDDGGKVNVKFEGDHLRKLYLNRAVKAIKHTHRRRIIEYRQGIKADVSLAAAELRKQEAEEIKKLGVESNGNTESEEGKREERTDSVGETSSSTTSSNRGGQTSKVDNRKEGVGLARRKEAIRRATARAGVAS